MRRARASTVLRRPLEQRAGVRERPLGGPRAVTRSSFSVPPTRLSESTILLLESPDGLMMDAGNVACFNGEVNEQGSSQGHGEGHRREGAAQGRGSDREHRATDQGRSEASRGEAAEGRRQCAAGSRKCQQGKSLIAKLAFRSRGTFTGGGARE